MTTRLQFCGIFHATFGGRDVTAAIRPGQERTLLAWLCLHRDHPVARRELVDALWSSPPDAAERSLAVLLSRLRATVGPSVIDGRSTVRLVLEPDAHVDFAVAREAIHRAEAAAHAGDWPTTWVAARIAHNIARRRFLPETDLAWVDTERRRLREVLLRAWECIGCAGIGLGGMELVSAVRAAQDLVAEEPVRESGHRLLMRALVARGDHAEALAVYARLRTMLAEELGVEPGPETQALYLEILRCGQLRAAP